MARFTRVLSLAAALLLPGTAAAQGVQPSAPLDSASAPAFTAPGADSALPVPAYVERGQPARSSGVFRTLRTIGGIAEERERAAQLRGGASTAGFLLRSPSSRTPRGDSSTYAALLTPSVEAAWNSYVPFSLNDGPMWAGRGGSSAVRAGVEVALGPLRLIAAPELVYEQNAEFRGFLPQVWDSAVVWSFIPPWQTGEHSVDLPYRFGDGAQTTLHPGESSLVLRLGAVEAGVATESEWWGPAVRNAIVLSNNAGGFPHALLRTARPLRTPLGALEARWIAGQLSASPFDTASVGGGRSLSAAALVLAPARTLAFGVARSVYAPLDGRGAVEDAADVFLRWRGAGDTTAAQPYEQMVSLFARWASPGDGAEVYGEWARRRLPSSPRDLLEQPEHTQGYTLGFAWLRPARAGALRIRGETTNLEKSATYRSRPTGSWYAGRAVPQGYTHRGQVLGAAIGPGASGQWLSVDYVAPRGQIGLSFTRVRWANDAYWDKPDGHNRYRAHDVSVLGGLRGGIVVGGMWMEAEWTAGRRYNFMFQNFSLDWDQRHLSVSPFNNTLRLRLSGAPPRFLAGR